jgi:glycosyltransferase involved in cell wall biosynthesis
MKAADSHTPGTRDAGRTTAVHPEKRSASPDRTPLVSIVVNNYNYEGYLSQAVDSALGQTHPRTEVVVVDDGSSDGSRGVIEAYGDSVVAVLKENGGQGSALNAGFQASRGEVVIFLDADDVLLPETASRVVAAFREDPRLTKVHYRMRVVDGRGVPTGETIPAAHVTMPAWDYRGDARRLAMEFPLSPRLPTSAAAHRASALREILPMPEDVYRISADGYLNYLGPVLGPATSLEDVGALYRVHGKNNYRQEGANRVNLVRLRDGLRRTERNYAEQRRLFEARYSVRLPEAALRNPEFLKDRMISVKLDPAGHPFDDRALPLTLRGVRAFLAYPTSPRAKLLYALWFLAMLLVPRAWAEPLAKLALSHEERRTLEGRLSSLRRRLFGLVPGLRSRTTSRGGVRES